MNQSNKFLKNNWPFLIVAVGIVLLIYTVIVSHRSKTDKADDKQYTRDEIKQEFKNNNEERQGQIGESGISINNFSNQTPQVNPSDNQGLPTSDENSVAIRGPETEPAYNDSQSLYKSYKNESFGISATLPQDAEVRLINEKTLIAFQNGSGSAYWSIYSYKKSDETLENLEKQIIVSNDTIFASRTTFNGKDAIEYKSKANPTVSNFALITNGKVYYLTGFAGSDSPLFKITL